MRIPNTVKIQSHTYEIKLVAPNELGNHDDGNVNKEKGVIVLNKKLIRTELEAAFIHEVLHVLNNELSHETIESLAQQLYLFLSENELLK